ncbi:MAG TPA: hypothetical protein VGM57_13095 [Pseudolabrys sp.]|jgi:hypothetical protein
MPIFALVRNAFGFVIAGLVVAAVIPAHAEIEKIMRQCDGKLCPFFRAPITVPDGWEENAEATRELGVQMLLPKGQDFEKAPAKIYVQVRYNRAKQPLTVAEGDVYRDWKSRDKTAKITKVADVTRANGKVAFVRHAFEAPKQKEQGFETLALMADGDTDGNSFYVIVCLSADTAEAYKSAEAAYLSILKAY